MRVIIAGSRGCTEPSLVDTAVRASGFLVESIVCGDARGIDAFALQYAIDHDIPVRVFEAKWHDFGPGAGYLRNVEMANHADALVAIWDGDSPGTEHMIAIAKKHQMPTYIFIYANQQTLEVD